MISPLSKLVWLNSTKLYRVKMPCLQCAFAITPLKSRAQRGPSSAEFSGRAGLPQQFAPIARIGGPFLVLLGFNDVRIVV